MATMPLTREEGGAPRDNITAKNGQAIHSTSDNVRLYFDEDHAENDWAETNDPTSCDGNGEAAAGAALDAAHADPSPQSHPSSHHTRGHLRTRTGGMPRRWLYDRCDGTSQPVATTPRPPSRICYAPPIAKLAPDVFEQNCCCEAVGAFGCFGLVDPAHAEHNIRFRRRMLTACLLINVVGLVFLVLSSLAISRNSFDLVWGFSFTNVWLEIVKGSDMYDGPTFFGVGLRAAAYQGLMRADASTSLSEGYTMANDAGDIISWNHTDTAQILIPFDQFCELAAIQPRSQEEVAVRAFVDAFEKGTGDCGSCSDMSHKIVPSLFLSMLGYIPNFIADIQRMYPGYDLNMSKCSASIFSWLTVATGIYTWANYHINCFAYLGEGETEGVAVDEEFNVVDPDSDDAQLVIRTNWGAAFGEVCLAVSMFLKIADIVLQGMLPTPTITRDYQEQVDYEWRYGNDRTDFGDEEEPLNGGTKATAN